jgi:hypothetical protein
MASSRKISDVLLSLPVSGTYVSNAHTDEGAVRAVAAFETIRLDVDGTFPQMMASGSYERTMLSLAKPTCWIAHPLKAVSYGTWEGPIVKVWGDASLIPHTKVSIHATPSQMYAFRARMTITFSGGPPAVTRVLEFISPWFREVTFEFDTVQDSPRVTTINTCAHANHPSSLPCENLTFDKVYDRAGVDVTQSPHRRTVPLADAGGAGLWSDAELDAAMHKYWSTYSDSPDWAIWVLFAGKHERTTLLGTMFDYSDQNQRQGCAIFNQALDDYVSSSYPQRAEHLARMRFFDAVHETGHCFNLHHAWLTYNTELNWPFFDTISDVATFMNYPEKVFDFFGKFEYRFHDSELKFLRHAPETFVEMGDAPFYGGQTFFEPDDRTAPRPWKLEITLHRPRSVFEFLEPVTLIATLTNTSGHPQMIDQAVLEDGGNFALVIARVEGRARFWRPFAQRCFLPTPRALEPGQSVSASFFAGAGLDGWYLAEPGEYMMQAVLKTPDAVIATNPLRLRIAHPRSWDEEVVAQNFFTRDVGRALAFGATPSRSAVVQTLLEVVERLPERAVSRHAALALAQGAMRDHRVLRTASGEEPGFDVVRADHEEARRLFQRALFENPGAAVESLGGETLRNLAEGYAVYLKQSGAAKAQRVRARPHKKGK